jgi:tetrahydromethanopterin S-methyltransferase subunit B
MNNHEELNLIIRELKERIRELEAENEDIRNTLDEACIKYGSGAWGVCNICNIYHI